MNHTVDNLLLLVLTMFTLTLLGGFFSMLGMGSRHFIKLADSDFLIGIMLAATAFGILIPGYSEINQSGNYLEIILFLSSIFIGFLSIYLSKKFFNFNRTGTVLNNIIILMSIHNFTEGLASGALVEKRVIANSFALLFIIGLQNIPEGIIAFLANTNKQDRTIKLAFTGVMITAICETFGNFTGAFLSSKLSFSIGYILAFSGGAMMQITFSEIIKKLKIQHTNNHLAFKIILGFFAMTLISL